MICLYIFFISFVCKLFSLSVFSPLLSLSLNLAESQFSLLVSYSIFLPISLFPSLYTFSPYFSLLPSLSLSFNHISNPIIYMYMYTYKSFSAYLTLGLSFIFWPLFSSIYTVFYLLLFVLRPEMLWLTNRCMDKMPVLIVFLCLHTLDTLK